jgi:hypothetical protein
MGVLDWDIAIFDSKPHYFYFSCSKEHSRQHRRFHRTTPQTPAAETYPRQSVQRSLKIRIYGGFYSSPVPASIAFINSAQDAWGSYFGQE